MRVVFRKLGRERALGQAYKHNGLIEIDSRLRGKRLLTTLIHEVLHIQNPDWSENKIENHSSELSSILWKQHFRKIDGKHF